MKRWISALAALSLLTLTSCMTVTLAPAGAYQAQTSYQVTLGRDWSDLTAVSYANTKAVRVLSIDGALLNRLYLIGGLNAGDTMIRTVTKDKPAPAIRSGMSATERMEFVADNITLLGYQRVETSRPRPAKFGGQDGLRFDFAGKTNEGLDMKGTAQVAEVDGKFYAIIYLAPAEHYYQATLAEAEAVMASAKFPG
jgi:hypothetical protein